MARERRKSRKSNAAEPVVTEVIEIDAPETPKTPEQNGKKHLNGVAANGKRVSESESVKESNKPLGDREEALAL